jgi:hypothetical protein
MIKQSNCKAHGSHPTKANKLRDIIVQCPYSSRHLFLMSILINLIVSILIQEEVTLIVATLLWGNVRMRLILPKWGVRSPLKFSKLQSSIAGVKTPHLEAFFISLESYQNLDVENGLAWAIWTSSAQVMAKRRAGNQTGNLTLDH